MLTVYLVRHAETDDNLNGIVSTFSDVPINETGIRQAEELGEELKSVKFSKLYTSDKQRTIQTADGILRKSQATTDLERIQTNLLRERSLGVWERKPSILSFEFAKKNGMTANDFKLYTPPEGEIFEDFIERIDSFFKILCDLADSSEEDQNILVCTHGMTHHYLHTDFLHVHRDTRFIIENSPLEEMKKQTENTVKSIFKIAKKPEGEEKRVISFIKTKDSSHLSQKSHYNYGNYMKNLKPS